MPVCIGCGASYDDSEKLCLYCGRYKPEAPKVEISVKVSEEAGKLTCPSCHRADKAQKVTAIVASQTSRAENSGGNAIKTDLAKALSKTPTAPKKPGNFELWMFGGAILTIWGIVLVIKSLFASDGSGGSIMNVLIFFLGLYLLGKGFINVGKWAEYNTERRKWSAAMKRYENLVYCAGCDCIFLSGKSTTAKVQALKNILSSD